MVWFMTDQQLPEESPSSAATQPGHRRRWQRAAAGTAVSLLLLGVGGAVGVAIGEGNAPSTQSASAPASSIPAPSPTTTVPAKGGGKHAGHHAGGKHKAQPVAPTTVPAPPTG